MSSPKTPPRYKLQPYGGLYVVVDTYERDKMVFGPQVFVIAELRRIGLQRAWNKEKQ